MQAIWIHACGKDGNNFVRTMLKLAETNDTLRVVQDQVGTPTSTVDLARVIFRLVLSDHATCQGQCSWYEFCL